MYGRTRYYVCLRKTDWREATQLESWNAWVLYYSMQTKSKRRIKWSQLHLNHQKKGRRPGVLCSQGKGQVIVISSERVFYSLNNPEIEIAEILIIKVL